MRFALDSSAKNAIRWAPRCKPDELLCNDAMGQLELSNS
jgi:hypothetical protein